ncbi:hypothetical protein PMIN03_003575 [Paraphaeosphaeria minitans]
MLSRQPPSRPAAQPPVLRLHAANPPLPGAERASVLLLLLLLLLLHATAQCTRRLKRNAVGWHGHICTPHRASTTNQHSRCPRRPAKRQELHCCQCVMTIAPTVVAGRVLTDRLAGGQTDRQTRHQ